AILATHVVALPILLRRVMRDGEEDLQDLPQREPPRVVHHFDHFRVIGAAAADGLIVCGGLAATCVTRPDREHARDVAVECFGAPEASAAEHDRALLPRCELSFVELGVRKRERVDTQSHGSSSGWMISRTYDAQAARSIHTDAQAWEARQVLQRRGL